VLASGPLIEVALAVKTLLDSGVTEPVLVFDDATGRVVDWDLHGTKADVIERLTAVPPVAPPLAQEAPDWATPTATAAIAAQAASSGESPRGRGRPKLGVVGREVTLLPRHWEWLQSQPGGPSVVLRKLVDQARRTGDAAHKARAAQDRCYHFMTAMAGDFPGFEEAVRALYARDREAFEQHMDSWSIDVRGYAVRLAFGREDVGSTLPIDGAAVGAA
jgi:hypothetical protein